LKGISTLTKQSLSVFVVCVAANIAIGQQPTEWRPSIAEDNKNASWDDTALFLSNTLTKYSQAVEIDDISSGITSVSSTKECLLEITTRASAVGESSCKQLQETPEGILGFSLAPISSEVASRIGREGYLIEGVRPESPAERSGIKPGDILLAVELTRSYGSRPQVFHLKSAEELTEMLHTDYWQKATKVKLVYKDRIDHSRTKWLEVPFDGTCRNKGVLTTECKIDATRLDPLSIELTNSRLKFSGTNNESFGSCSKQGTPDAVPRDITKVVSLQFSDLEIAKRASRAVLHASILCGGKKAVSPF
jgi:PDZ domain